MFHFSLSFYFCFNFMKFRVHRTHRQSPRIQEPIHVVDGKISRQRLKTITSLHLHPPDHKPIHIKKNDNSRSISSVTFFLSDRYHRCILASSGSVLQGGARFGVFTFKIHATDSSLAEASSERD